MRDKENKTPGPDGIPAELLKEGRKVIMPTLRTLLNECLHKREIPKECNEGIVVLMFKKGDRSNIKISLLCQVYKLFHEVISDRLTYKMDSHQPVEQAGFRRTYNTSDHLLTMRILMEKANDSLCFSLS